MQKCSIFPLYTPKDRNVFLLITQTAEAFLMVFFFRFYNRCRNQKKVDENSFDIEEKKGLDFTDSEKGETDIFQY